MFLRSLRDLVAILLLAACYFGAGKLGLSLAFVHVSATAVWPPAGIALAALLLLGYRVWPGIFLGAFLVNLTTAGSVATSIGIATGNTLEGLVGAYLINRFANGRHAYDHSQDVFRASALAAVVSTTVSATLGVTSLCLGGFADIARFGSIWLTWWLGDAAGNLVVAPLCVLWITKPRPRWKGRKVLEGVLLFLAIALVASVEFGGLLPIDRQHYPLGFLSVPILMWAAFRFGQREAATVIAILSTVAIWGTLRGHGPFARWPTSESLLLLQAFMAVMATTTIAVAAVVAERRRFESKLVRLADHDGLTDVLNRRRFLADLSQQLALARRYGTHGALLFLDLDDFKAVNDRRGHLVGDRVLASISHLLRGRLRDSDLLARMGGDEFAILLPHTDGPRAQAVAAQLQGALRSHRTLLDGETVVVTASMGIALFPEHGSTAADLLANADTAMYEAKAAGHNLVRVCSAATAWQGRIETQVRGEQSIREALQKGAFLLHGQPILDLRRARIDQYELLLRMADEGGDLIPPAGFLPTAEQSGLIHGIERWVVRQAIHLIADWWERRSEPSVSAPGLSVNISGRAFSDEELLPLIRRELKATAIDPGKLIFEVTETVAVAQTEQTRRFAAGLKSLGCRFALDDFGVGSSWLHQLKDLPVDFLKIDGSFIRDLPRSTVDRHLVKAIVDMARALGKQTVAEFVGDEDTVHLLRECGVDYAQGYHIGRPRAVSEIQ
jgi:diguanylate cyclase (GGDEF)-like protein